MKSTLDVLTLQQPKVFFISIELLDAKLVFLNKPGIILGIGSAIERRRYYVTPSLIGWAHTKNNLR